MGGRPTQAVISIGVNPEMDVAYIESVYEGMKACAFAYGVNIVGGDTVSSPDNLVLNVSLLGWVDEDKYLLRSGAKPGDVVLVTNVLGDSRAGLDLVLGNCSISPEGEEYLLGRHYYSTPRVEEIAAGVSTGFITSADDISDGLGSEIHEIADASGVGAVLWFDALPASAYTREVAEKTGNDLTEYTLFGGEDFEVVMTVPADKADALSQVIEAATGTKVTKVGEIVERSQGVKLLRNNTLQVLEKRGYSHFKD
jgi:thiamine-monophosphate kinase